MQVRRFSGQRLRDARRAKGISQSQLAMRIAAHVTSVSDWERGSNSPSGRHVASLARELGVDVGQFYGDDDEESALPRSGDLAEVLRLLIQQEVRDALRKTEVAA